MMRMYVRSDDDTQVSYSDVLDDNTIKVVVKRSRDRGFVSAAYLLPAYSCSDVERFPDEELAKRPSSTRLRLSP